MSKKKNHIKSKKINSNNINKSSINGIYEAKLDYNIPRFGFKSASILVLASTVATFIIPYILSFVGISFKLSVVLGNALITSYAVAYSRYFIESKKGYCKKFYITYGIFTFSFGIIGFFWMYLNAYI